ncbi:MAG: hypothetical protein ACREDM_15250 [Methylocella sp.]
MRNLPEVFPRGSPGACAQLEQRGAFSTGDAPGDDPAAENFDAAIEMEADFNAKVKSLMHSLQRNAEKICSLFQKDALKYAARNVRILMH